MISILRRFVELSNIFVIRKGEPVLLEIEAPEGITISPHYKPLEPVKQF